MRVAIYGTGGVGGYYGGRLAQSGIDVAFIARGAHLDALRNRGLRVSSVAGDFDLPRVHVFEHPADVGPVDYVLISVKSWQLPRASELRPMMHPSTGVVSLLNGVEAPDALAEEIGRDNVLPGTVRIFSEIAGPGVIRHFGGAATIAFAEWDDRPSQRVEALRAAFQIPGVSVQAPLDIRQAIWEKFLFVVPMGSVGAVTRAPIGVTRALPETRAMLRDAIVEIHRLGRANGIAFAEDAVERTLGFVDSQPEDGTSSLQRDIAAGRRSELDAWTGAVVRLGRKAGVSVPIHDLVHGALLPLELRARGVVEFD